MTSYIREKILLCMSLVLAVGVLAMVGSGPAYAQEVEHESDFGHETEHHEHENVVSFFAGVTHGGRRKNALALGVAYERLLNEKFAMGVFAEHSFGDADFTVYAVAFAYRMDRWKFYVAPGIEDSDAHGTESLVRLGTEYAYEVGTWEMSPHVAVDFVDGDQELVLGVVFGKGF